MKLELIALAVAIIGVGSTEQGRAGDGADREHRPTYLYCKKDNLHNEATALVCNCGTTINEGCIGGQYGRIDKKDVGEVIGAFKQCNDGRWLSRIEVKEG